MSSPRILIVGSGAVGAIYGHYLSRAGCHVRYLVRNIASPSCQMPRQLHRIGLLGGTTSTLQNLRIQTIGDSGWDQVWLCLPSDALDSEWLKTELARVGTTSPVILWSPTLEDRQRLHQLHRAEITLGLIGLVSYQSPLPGDDSPSPGIAYLAPPRSAVLENSSAGEDAASWLKRGGLSCTTHAHLPALAARLSSALIPLIAALEISGWSISTLRQSKWLTTADHARQEAQRIGENFLRIQHRHRVPGRHLLVRGALRLAPALSPFPLETYLHYHFGKVGTQTRLMLDTWLSKAQHQDEPAPALTALRTALP